MHGHTQCTSHTCILAALRTRVRRVWRRSHAGRHFRLTPSGVWWATLPEPVMRACLSADGVSRDEESEAFVAERARFDGPAGDRRQEIVFIGTGVEPPSPLPPFPQVRDRPLPSRFSTALDGRAIGEALDACLLTDAEYDQYQTVWAVEDARIAEGCGPFRFPVGAAVECCLGEGQWARGTVVQHFYREGTWPPDRWMPYQVRLDGDVDDETIWAPLDVDQCIRKARG